VTTLITGADGYLGRRIAAALAGDELVLTVRAHDATELAHKRVRLGRALGTARRITVVPVDLREPGALAELDPRPITHIVHAAAITRFGVDRETAGQVNLGGTARVREFAERCARLERLVVLSTLYTAGRRQGEVSEVRHHDAGFVNHYEWSKWASEERVLDPPALPVVVARLPTVIADDDGAAVGQYNAFHHTLRLFYYGLLTLLPGDPATPLSLATAGFTVEAVTALLDAEPGIYQVCPGPVPLGVAVETAFTTFDRDAAFRRRMLPRPIPCDWDSFSDLAGAVNGLRGGPLHEVLASVVPFAEQLYLPKRFRTERLRSAWPDYRARDPVALVESVTTRLVASRWGRQPRPQAETATEESPCP
jgi:nucleoside-diphosphate-sugar epimerase